MIKASELRIGNKIEAVGFFGFFGSYPSGLIEVREITEFGVNLSQGDSTIYELYNLHPIPLTEEWLVKFGAEYKDYFGGHVFWIGASALAIKGNIAYWMANSLCKIDFVHQLQNLYHALTGEELQIKTDQS